MHTLGKSIGRTKKSETCVSNLRIFQKKAHLFLTHIPERSDTFQWLALMQHHGAPTRLLDFTWSRHVAAFFALERTTKRAAVWAVNPKRLVNVTESPPPDRRRLPGGPRFIRRAGRRCRPERPRLHRRWRRQAPVLHVPMLSLGCAPPRDRCRFEDPTPQGQEASQNPLRSNRLFHFIA
jgi:hypothetical protein